MTIKFDITDVAGSTPFDNDTNGFVSDNVQDAIEEARQSTPTLGRSFIVEFSNNGNTQNKWLQHIPTSEATDTLPYHSAWDLDIFGISFSNKNSNIDCDVEIYVNGTAPGDLVYTMQVRDFRYYYETTTADFFTVAAGDDISIYIKKIGNSSPSSVDLELNVRINSLNTGSGGAN